MSGVQARVIAPDGRQSVATSGTADLGDRGGRNTVGGPAYLERPLGRCTASHRPAALT
ncbi:hypothetical protein [Streptomyces tendae]|uniref:hypothetical protein n=1 Tax=Streptomyces tendae TaxID=1932 RepID=UPI0019161527|nr:hypothetical protein [Streptomyces tendae]